MRNPYIDIMLNLLQYNIALTHDFVYSKKPVTVVILQQP